MILINLLPHREEKRRLRKQAFFAGLGLAVGVGGLLVAGGYAVQQQMISNQQARNDYLLGRLKLAAAAGDLGQEQLRALNSYLLN